MSAPTSTATIVIVLDLGQSLDHPRGTAALPGAEPRPFHGWLGLTAAIESLTEERRLLGLGTVSGSDAVSGRCG